jgi:phosphate starvation-inducible PhoH-like protein
MSENAERFKAKKEKTELTPKKKARVDKEIERVKQFHPSESQKTAINVAKQFTLSFVYGPPGTGKSTAILWDYCQEYLKDNSKQIIVIKSPTEAGSLDKLGFLPGMQNEKLEAHFVANRKILEDFLGKGKVECDLTHRIHLLPPNYLLGCTFDNSLILVEEAQQLQPMILKLILERTGVNSRVCVVGDPMQLYTDSKESRLRNGLSDAIYRFFNEDGSPRFDSVGQYQFTAEDVMRSDIVKTVIKAYYGV